MKDLILLGCLFLLSTCQESQQKSNSVFTGQTSSDTSTKIIEAYQITDKTSSKIIEDSPKKKIKSSLDQNEPKIFNHINDYDSLGRPYLRWIEFRDTSNNIILKKIDLIEKDNPYFQVGLSIHSIDENGPQIYYDLGKKANRNTVKPFLPDEEYQTIPANLFYPMALSFVEAIQRNQYLIINYSFEWVGLEREWIRGEYIGHAVLVYNEKGEEVYRKMNTPGSLSYISTDADYLFFVQDKNHDDWEKQEGCISLHVLRQDSILFQECTPKSTWHVARGMLGEFVSFGNCKRHENYCFQSLLYNANTNSFF